MSIKTNIILLAVFLMGVFSFIAISYGVKEACAAVGGILFSCSFIFLVGNLVYKLEDKHEKNISVIHKGENFERYWPVTKRTRNA